MNTLFPAKPSLHNFDMFADTEPRSLEVHARNMIYSVANPIYDSVLNFLMEAERIAKAMLSALLKKEVKSIILS